MSPISRGPCAKLQCGAPATLCSASARPQVRACGPSESVNREDIAMMSRRTFTSALAVGAAVALMPHLARAEDAPGARNVVLVHGLFADGSCWSEVIARLQAAGLNVTSVQNPLTTLDDAVAATQRVLARQDGPTVLVGHSFAGMIVTEAGVDPKVSAARLRRGAGPGRGRGLHGTRQAVPYATRLGGHRLRRRRRTTHRGCVSARFRRRSARGPGKGALCGPSSRFTRRF